MTRFRFDIAKTSQAIDFIARNVPGVTQYYIGKILFFADREHVLDYGRPITGDRYVAMEHGPVPSTTRDLLRADTTYPDEMLDALFDRIVIEHSENKQHVYSKDVGDFPDLSGSDQEYLLAAIETYRDMSFTRVKRLSHDDPAYVAAWEKGGNNNEMDVSLWMDQLDDPELARNQLEEKSRRAF